MPGSAVQVRSPLPLIQCLHGVWGIGPDKNTHVVSAEEAAALVKCSYWLDFGAWFNQPDTLDRAFAARKETFRVVRIRNYLSMKPRAFLG